MVEKKPAVVLESEVIVGVDKECKTCSLSAYCMSWGGPSVFAERFVVCSGCYGTLFDTGTPLCLSIRPSRCRRLGQALKRMRLESVPRTRCPNCMADEENSVKGEWVAVGKGTI